MKQLSLIFLLVLSLFLFFGCTSSQLETKNLDSSLVGTWIASSAGTEYLLKFDINGNWEVKQTSFGNSPEIISGTYYTKNNILYSHSDNASYGGHDQQETYFVDENTLRLKVYPEDLSVEEITYIKVTNVNQILFIGDPSLGEKIVVDEKYSYDINSATSLFNATYEDLQFYKVIILDQSKSNEKSVSVALSDSLQNYVQKGGKLIIVLNSAIYSSVSAPGYTAVDAIGWLATLGKLSPAYCGSDQQGIPSCKEGNEVNVLGRIFRQDYDHPIMQGIEIFPMPQDYPLSLTTLSITADAGAKTLAYIKSENTPLTYPAILEKKGIMGDVIYFNYDPGLTKDIFENTLAYLIK